MKPLFFLLLVLSVVRCWEIATVSSGVHPHVRSDPCVVSVEGDDDDDEAGIYFWGGIYDPFLNPEDWLFFNDLHKFNPNDNSWSEINAGGDVPAPRTYVGCGLAKKSRIYVFGGVIYNPTYTEVTPFGDLSYYDIKDNEWHTVEARNEGPSPRIGPAMVAHKNTLYIHAGLEVTQFGFFGLNDLWTYNIRHNKWSLIFANGQDGGAAPQNLHHLHLHHDTLYLGFGEGGQDSGFNLEGDLWKYNLDHSDDDDDDDDHHRNHNNDDVFIKLNACGQPNPARNYVGSALVDDQIVIHGGDQQTAEICCGAPFPQDTINQTFVYDISQNVWRSVGDAIPNSPELKRHRLTVFGDNFYILAGHTWVNENNIGKSWNSNVYVQDVDELLDAADFQ